MASGPESQQWDMHEALEEGSPPSPAADPSPSDKPVDCFTQVTDDDLNNFFDGLDLDAADSDPAEMLDTEDANEVFADAEATIAAAVEEADDATDDDEVDLGRFGRVFGVSDVRKKELSGESN